ncbi:IclR family transcriptional regulator [Brevibacillus humidisoli]|uniref:IclR family transcriptional regulator n=1 Tax=Brevibacillus humidisoli TaxID=2895522 RepID=UPI001E4C932D|nr:IclR family transcriptional regulator [Brevibacillus humidisoli]UFJ41391.1 IclR family transcriptional regulator [Brevibacillus humidisoli]
MQKKYWVPAVERADAILHLLAAEPSQLRLMDLSNRLGIHKSSMFSLLHTMETLGWIVKEKGDTYSLGPSLGALSASYFRQFSILESFYLEAVSSVKRVDETVQLSILDGRDIIYLAKRECAGPVRVVTDPGMRYPAYATAMGKVQLSQFSYDQLKTLYPEPKLEAKTPFTVKDVDQLWQQLEQIRGQGYGSEQQEATPGFYCVAAPIFNHENRIIAAVSFTMLENRWLEKSELATTEIIDLARRLSTHAGHTR